MLLNLHKSDWQSHKILYCQHFDQTWERINIVITWWFVSANKQIVSDWQQQSVDTLWCILVVNTSFQRLISPFHLSLSLSQHIVAPVSFQSPEYCSTHICSSGSQKNFSTHRQIKTFNTNHISDDQSGKIIKKSNSINIRCGICFLLTFDLFVYNELVRRTETTCSC